MATTRRDCHNRYKSILAAVYALGFPTAITLGARACSVCFFTLSRAATLSLMEHLAKRVTAIICTISQFASNVHASLLNVEAGLLNACRVSAKRGPQVRSDAQFLNRLRDAFDVPMAVLELGSGELNHVSALWLHVDIDCWRPVVDEVARRGKPQIVEDCAPLAVLAVPLPADQDHTCERVAIATFLTQQVTDRDQVVAAAGAVGVDIDTVWRWTQRQQLWPTRAIEQLSQSMVEHASTEAQNQHLRRQLTNVSRQLLQTFDELNLLHRINDRVSLETDESELLETAVRWLSLVLPAECLLACLKPANGDRDESGAPHREWIYAGDCPIDNDDLNTFFDRLGPDARNSSIVIDREVTGGPTWYYPAVREVISVPIRSGSSTNGWLVAINHQPELGRAGDDFGNLETSLLSSVASMLGMHSGNVRLYNDQSNFFESVVRALSSAIDAKDPYTRGHSERVARISVLMARQLGCDAEELNTIYLSGLLHDIGKIGIDDTILRKPGSLTSEEFEHIKQHPELGHRILKGVRQLQHVLPVVLHHHEAWDGSGYPNHLVGTDCPWLARIVGVADAFDAMSSDRPYRAGMPTDQINTIFRTQSGTQWDPQVIEAFFAVRDAIDEIVDEDREQLSLDVRAWTAS